MYKHEYVNILEMVCINKCDAVSFQNKYIDTEQSAELQHSMSPDRNN